MIQRPGAEGELLIRKHEVTDGDIRGFVETSQPKPLLELVVLKIVCAGEKEACKVPSLQL